MEHGKNAIHNQTSKILLTRLELSKRRGGEPESEEERFLTVEHGLAPAAVRPCWCRSGHGRSGGHGEGSLRQIHLLWRRRT
jgi:hypothetical protein